MQSARVVLETVLSVLLVMGVGALARRRGLIGESGVASMSRLVADVTFPALCFAGLVHADAETLRGGVLVAALGFVTLAVAAAVGLALAHAAKVSERSRAT